MKLRSFSKWISNEVDNTGISVKQITADTGLADQTVRNWIRDLKTPNFDNAEMIADYFGYDIVFVKRA